MLISPFSPLFFYYIGGKRQSDGVESRYTQTFARTDAILIECICSDDEDSPTMVLHNEEGDLNENINFRMWEAANGMTVYYATLQGLSEDIYFIECGDLRCHRFKVTNDPEELRMTTLIQYSMKDNRQRTDAAFLLGGMRYFFDFRVHGGFKDSEISFGCESEQFADQNGDISTLYALDSTQRKFTMGCQDGVPARFAELLNRLLCCTYVYFDGERYTRMEASVPEINVQIEGIDSFVFKQTLQKAKYLDPIIEAANHLALRRVDDDGCRVVNINGETFNRNI